MVTYHVFEGSRYEVGARYAETLVGAIHHNLDNFWTAARAGGIDTGALVKDALAMEKDYLSEARREELVGIARASGRGYEEVLAYNTMHGRVFPDECTVLLAMGDATKSGRVIFAKNSDKIGRADMVGPGFYQNKEINVILALRPDDGPAVIGVSAAGSTGLKMGMNSVGVAAGCNLSRTIELNERAASTTAMRALDRVQLVRDGLDCSSAMEAGLKISAHLARQPMSTPGNLQYVDSNEAVFIEASYERMAMGFVRSGIDSRSNQFVILREMNNPEDLSSHCRYVRTQQLLRQYKGEITMEHMMAFTADHENGPSMNSICRHSDNYEHETSQSSMVMELDPDNPEKSRCAIALGKQCHSWRSPEGHLRLDMTFQLSDIPEGFKNGEVWKKFWTEEPNLEKFDIPKVG